MNNMGRFPGFISPHGFMETKHKEFKDPIKVKIYDPNIPGAIAKELFTKLLNKKNIQLEYVSIEFYFNVIINNEIIDRKKFFSIILN